jgi:hypothetical protein
MSEEEEEGLVRERRVGNVRAAPRPQNQQRRSAQDGGGYVERCGRFSSFSDRWRSLRSDIETSMHRWRSHADIFQIPQSFEMQ